MSPKRSTAAVDRKLARFDGKIREKGFTLLGGADESGRGALAGPLVSSAIILPSSPIIKGLNDCKQLTPLAREKMYEILIEKAISWTVVRIEAQEIDAIGLQRANVMAMEEAIRLLDPVPDFVVTDRYEAGAVSMPHLGVTRGDCVSASVAAASIIAKVTRDRIMRLLDKEYPDYGFAKHKGYGTQEHLTAIREFGPSPEHRRSFAGVLQ